MRRILVVALCVVVTGCVSSGESVGEDQLSEIVSGKTTSADLVRIIGEEPTSRTYSPDGSQIMVWSYVRIGMFFGVGTKIQTLSMSIGPTGTVSGYSRAGSRPVSDHPLATVSESASTLPSSAQPLSKQSYKDAQVQELMQKSLSYEEYQRQYRAIMAE